MREAAALLFLAAAAGLLLMRPKTDLGTMDTRELMARTIYGEARGGGAAAMADVAAVIMNRAARPSWWGGDVRGVITKPWQFSLWWANSPGDASNRAATLAATEADPLFADALAIADLAIAGRLEDRTGGADHYHADWMSPSWAGSMTRTVARDRHIFYRST